MNLERLKQLPNLEQLKKAGIGVAVGVAMWVALYFLALGPILANRAETGQKMADLQQELKNNKALIQEAEKVQDRYEKARQELLEIMTTKLVPTGSYRSPLTWIGGIVQETARRHGVAVDNLSNAGTYREEVRGRDAPPPIFEEYQINVDLTGGYHEFGRFIAEMERALPYSKVDSVRLRSQRGPERNLAIVMKYGIPKFTEDGFPKEKRPQRAEETTSTSEVEAVFDETGEQQAREEDETDE